MSLFPLPANPFNSDGRQLLDGSGPFRSVGGSAAWELSPLFAASGPKRSYRGRLKTTTPYFRHLTGLAGGSHSKKIARDQPKQHCLAVCKTASSFRLRHIKQASPSGNTAAEWRQGARLHRSVRDIASRLNPSTDANRRRRKENASEVKALMCKSPPRANSTSCFSRRGPRSSKRLSCAKLSRITNALTRQPPAAPSAAVRPRPALAAIARSGRQTAPPRLEPRGLPAPAKDFAG